MRGLSEWLDILFCSFSTGTGCGFFLTLAVMAGIFFGGIGIVIAVAGYVLLMASIIVVGSWVDRSLDRRMKDE